MYKSLPKCCVGKCTFYFLIKLFNSPSFRSGLCPDRAAAVRGSQLEGQIINISEDGSGSAWTGMIAIYALTWRQGWSVCRRWSCSPPCWWACRGTAGRTAGRGSLLQSRGTPQSAQGPSQRRDILRLRTLTSQAVIWSTILVNTSSQESGKTQSILQEAWRG